LRLLAPALIPVDVLESGDDLDELVEVIALEAQSFALGANVRARRFLLQQKCARQA